MTIARPFVNIVGRRFYAVRVEAVGRVGEVLVSIDGAKGHLPLFFRPEDMVKDTVRRYDL